MKQYLKIPNIFKFDEKKRDLVSLNEDFDYLKNNIWIGTEKIDGTNIRIYWDGYDITFYGHTEKSIIPDNLNEYLANTFLTNEMEYVFEQMFGEKEVIIFGEGYGYKIQNNGDQYTTNNECSLIVFDIIIDGYWLNRDNVDDIASRLNLKSVPTIFEGNLPDAIDFIKKHPMSTLNNGLHEMEGLVLDTKMCLYDVKGNPIKCKIKYNDVRKWLLTNNDQNK